MNKNFALLSLLAFAEAIQLDCGLSCGDCGCGGDDKDEDDSELYISEEELREIALRLDDFDQDYDDDYDYGMATGLPSHAYIYENEDCTGDYLTLDLLSYHNAIEEYDTAELVDMGWNDKGASLKLDHGTTLTVWQHPDKTGQSETFTEPSANYG